MDCAEPVFRQQRRLLKTTSWMSNSQQLQRRVKPINVIYEHQHRQNSSSIEIAGLRQLSNQSASVAMKIVWLVVFLGATIICIFQCTERIAHYTSNPLRVNVRFIQKNTFKPPAVTICPYCYGEVLRLDGYWITKRLGLGKDEHDVWDLMEKGNISLSEFWSFSKLNIVNVSLLTYDNAAGSASMQKDLVSFSEVDTSHSVCHRIKLNVDLKRFIARPRFVLKITEKPEGQSNCKRVSLNVLEESTIDEYFYQFTGVYIGNYFDMKYVARVTETVFQNTSKSPCGDNEQVSSCLVQCFENIFIPKETRMYCRLPFIRYSNNTPPCRTKAEFHEMMAATSAATLQFNPAECNCLRQCRQVRYTADYVYRKETYSDFTWVIEVNVPDGRITLLEEESAYNGYDVFADLGGCLGLWLGLCLLQILEVGTLCFWNQFKHLIKFISRKSEPKPINVKGKRFRLVVVRDSDFKPEFIPTIDLPGFRNVGKQEFPVWVRGLWLSVSLVTLLICIQQCVERITLYVEDPSTVQVYYTNDATVPFPSIMLCHSQSDGLTAALSASLLSNTLDKTHRYKDVLQLISQGQLTIDDAWNMPGIAVEFVDTNTSVHNDWILSTVPTVLGNCLNFQPKGIIDYKGPSSSQFLHIFTGREHGTKLVVIYQKEELALIKYLLQLDCTELEFYEDSWKIQTAFRITQMSYRNLRNNPCLEREQSVRCLVKCLEKNIAQKIPQSYCRLPFMNTTKSACNSTIDMAAVLNVTFSTIDTFNIEDCVCFKACEEFVYTKEYFTIAISYGEQGKLSLQMQVWNKEILVTEEVRAYNAYSLFADLGGSMGLFSGICVINLFEIVEVLFVKMIIFFKSRYCLKRTKQKILPNLHPRRIILLEGSAYATWNENQERITLAHTRKSENNRRLPNRIIWFMISTVLFCPFMYLSLQRLQYYMSDPSASTTYYSQNKTIRYPIMLMCPKVDYSVYSDQNDDIKFLDYWNMSLFQSEVDMVGLLINWRLLEEDDAILTQTTTAAGICYMLIPSKPVQYIDLSTQIRFYLKVRQLKKCWVGIFPIEKLPLARYISPRDSYTAKGYAAYGMEIKMQITEVVRRNTRQFPCEDSGLVALCLANCIERKIYAKHDKKCRLPFMQDSKSCPLCQTNEEYLAVKHATLSILENFNQTDCKCNRECRVTMYSVDDLIFATSPADNVEFSVRIPETSFPTIQEEAAYSFIKLLSDLGGSLGLFFGFGLLQLLEMLATTASQLKTRINVVLRS